MDFADMDQIKKDNRLKYDDYNHAFINACYDGRLDIVQLILSKKLSPNVNMEQGLSQACEYNHVSIIMFLLSNYKQYINWSYGIARACYGGHLSLVKFLIEQTGNKFRDWSWFFEDACLGGHVNVVEFLILQGANNWHQGFLLACRRKHLPVVAFLLSSNVVDKINPKNGLYDMSKLAIDPLVYRRLTGFDIDIPTLVEDHQLSLSRLKPIDGKTYSNLAAKFKNIASTSQCVVQIKELATIVVDYLVNV
jgi:ankyrin repeat protein